MSFCFSPTTEATLRVSHVFVNQRAIGQTLFSFAIRLQRRSGIVQHSGAICALGQPCFAQFWRQCDRAICSLLNRRRRIQLRIDAVVVKKAPNNAESGPGKGKIRVELDGFRISLGSILKGGATGLTVLDTNATQISIVSSRICRRTLRANLFALASHPVAARSCWLPRSRRQRHHQVCGRNCWPRVSVGACVDQLHIHADLVG